MSSDEADERIMSSAHILDRYRAMMDGGSAPLADLLLIEAELQVLSNIASEHPAKGEVLIRLVTDWVAFREGLKAKLH